MQSEKLVIVTPLRNEIKHLPKLFNSIQVQSIEISAWIILENGSTDGSKEFLNKNQPLNNVNNLKIINLDIESEYQLGFKYSSIVRFGFDYVKKHFHKYDYIGILDADCFPEPEYYSTLIQHLDKNASLGIAGGMPVSEEGTPYPYSEDFPKGACRIWSRACFEDAGYVVSMSADSVSCIKARLKGWETRLFTEIVYQTRQVGDKIGSLKYYGESAYYRGFTPTYALLRGIKFGKDQGYKKGIEYLTGYFKEGMKKGNKIDDTEVIKYHRKWIPRNIKNIINRRLNFR